MLLKNRKTCVASSNYNELKAKDVAKKGIMKHDVGRNRNERDEGMINEDGGIERSRQRDPTRSDEFELRTLGTGKD
ncbi:hypothetical protein PGT21_028883 [Puccinia graminis f. sp. tritici]|uniref:Uncharacterized protein n=1 Tax=Puccinia graminis f. sp. tritici TaxID=56615 RepID=A0A5B0RR87_PUCGR|nr:hypothetical protein PGT21_028883 [Puccinia graminis f. sp. tritici]KAA1128330.1 hypothetical protein PGTUg99_009331 [Puccinia graminis f. sp. tritici]